MSKPSNAPVTCSCGLTFSSEVFRSANVTLQPELKDRILDGRFNRVRCPACGRESDAAVPFLYHDMSAGLMVWVYPADRVEEASSIREKIRKSFEIVGTVLPHDPADDTQDLVFGIDELRSLITTRD